MENELTYSQWKALALFPLTVVAQCGLASMFHSMRETVGTGRQESPEHSWKLRTAASLSEGAQSIKGRDLDSTEN